MSAAKARLAPDMKSTPDLVLKASQSVKAGVAGNLSEIGEGADAARERILAVQREGLAGRHAEKQREEPAEILPPLREEVEELELELPDGRTVVMAPPPAGQLFYKIAQVLQGDYNSAIMQATLRMFMHIRSIDGRALPAISSAVDLVKQMNEFGEATLDLLTYVTQTNWPPFTVGDLKIVKKTLKATSS